MTEIRFVDTDTTLNCDRALLVALSMNAITSSQTEYILYLFFPVCNTGLE